MRLIFLSLLIFYATPAKADLWLLAMGLTADRVEVEGADDPIVGASFRARTLDYRQKASGTTYGLNFRSTFAFDFFYGWGMVFGGSTYWEAAAGFAYGIISGPGVFVITGPGMDLDSKFSVALPFTYRSSFYWELPLQIGYKF